MAIVIVEAVAEALSTLGIAIMAIQFNYICNIFIKLADQRARRPLIGIAVAMQTFFAMSVIYHILQIFLDVEDHEGHVLCVAQKLLVAISSIISAIGLHVANTYLTAFLKEHDASKRRSARARKQAEEERHVSLQSCQRIFGKLNEMNKISENMFDTLSIPLSEPPTPKTVESLDIKTVQSEQLGALGNQKIKHGLKQLNRKVLEVLWILDKTLLFAELNGAELKPSSTNLRELGQQVIESVKFQCKSSVDLRLECICPNLLLCDARLLSKMLVILASNALQTCDSGAVLFRFSTVPKAAATDPNPDPNSLLASTRPKSAFKHNRIMFEIVDSGPGIPATEAKRLFESDAAMFKEKDGMGLVIAKRIARLCGTTLQIESPLPGSNGGSRVFFYLDLVVSRNRNMVMSQTLSISMSNVKSNYQQRDQNTVLSLQRKTRFSHRALEEETCDPASHGETSPTPQIVRALILDSSLLMRTFIHNKLIAIHSFNEIPEILWTLKLCETPTAAIKIAKDNRRKGYPFDVVIVGLLGKETGVIRRLKEVSPRTAIIALDTVGDLNHHEVKGVDITWELPVPSSSTIAEQLSTFIKPERKKNLVAQSNNTNRLVPPIPGGHRRNRSRSSTVGMYLTPLNELNRNVDYGKSASALVEELNISGQRQASDQTTNPPKAVAGLIKHSLSKSPVSARPRQHVQVFFPSHPATSNVKVALPLTPVKPEGVTRRVVFSDEIKKYDAKPNVSR